MLQEQNDIVWQNALFAGDDQITLQLPGVWILDFGLRIELLSFPSLSRFTDFIFVFKTDMIIALLFSQHLIS
jgi:hypothetical protein